jgi:CII-binding regulator of phage lambda lysogenization HflD
MSNIKTNPNRLDLTKYLDLIRFIGDRIIDIDVVRAEFPRESVVRKNLDNLRDTLDTCQRRLVRKGIHAKSDEFIKHTLSLTKINEKLHERDDDLTTFANNLKALVKLVAVVEKIVNLIPKPVG